MALTIRTRRAIPLQSATRSRESANDAVDVATGWGATAGDRGDWPGLNGGAAEPRCSLSATWYAAVICPARSFHRGGYGRNAPLDRPTYFRGSRLGAAAGGGESRAGSSRRRPHGRDFGGGLRPIRVPVPVSTRSEEHTSELQSPLNL